MVGFAYAAASAAALTTKKQKAVTLSAMRLSALNPTSFLAVLLVIVTAFLLFGVPVSAKVALGPSHLKTENTVEKTIANSLKALEKIPLPVAEWHRRNAKSKTLATLGNGNITIRDDEANGTDSTERLNRDLENTEKELFSSNHGMSVEATIDTRMLTEEGRQEIKNNFVDSYEFGEDIYRASEQLNKSDQLGLLNFWSALHNNTQNTQLKNELVRNPEHAHIIEGLRSGDGEQYAQAMQNLGALAQAQFGLDITSVNFYNSDQTTSVALADSAGIDIHGGVVIDQSNSQYGNIFIDAEGTKNHQVNTLGHELFETQTLQQGGANDATQEALANAFGGQFEDRIDQATGSQLSSTSTSSWSQSLNNSNAVQAGTQAANQVGNSRTDHYLTFNQATNLADLQRQLLTDNNLTADERADIKNKIAQLQRQDKKLDQIAKTACQLPSSQACENAIRDMSEAGGTYLDAGVLQDPGSAPLSVSQEGQGLVQDLRGYTVEQHNTAMTNIEHALEGLVKDSINGTIGLAEMLVKLKMHDSEAFEQAAKAYISADQFIQDPIGNTADAIEKHYAEVERLKQSSDPADHDRAAQMEARFTAEVVSALAGVSTIVRQTGKQVVKNGTPDVDATAPTNSTNPGMQPGAVDAEIIGQPYRFSPKDFSENRQLTAAEINMAHSVELGTDFIPYKEGTITTERFLQPGEKFYSVEYPTQSAPGGWATPKRYTSIEEARKELALLPEFKDSSGGLVIREYTVKTPTPVREGKVGGLLSENGKRYEGGGDQIEFLFDRGSRDKPEWKKYFDEPTTYELTEK